MKGMSLSEQEQQVGRSEGMIARWPGFLALNFLPGPILPLSSLTPLGDSPAPVTRGQFVFCPCIMYTLSSGHQRGGTAKFIQGKQWTPNSSCR